jgi:hypothetical protein
MSRLGLSMMGRKAFMGLSLGARKGEMSLFSDVLFPRSHLMAPLGFPRSHLMATLGFPRSHLMAPLGFSHMRCFPLWHVPVLSILVAARVRYHRRRKVNRAGTINLVHRILTSTMSASITRSPSSSPSSQSSPPSSGSGERAGLHHLLTSPPITELGTVDCNEFIISPSEIDLLKRRGLYGGVIKALSKDLTVVMETHGPMKRKRRVSLWSLSPRGLVLPRLYRPLRVHPAQVAYSDGLPLSTPSPLEASSFPTLKDWQVSCVNLINTYFTPSLLESHSGGCICDLPCGRGKTVVGLEMIRQMGRRALVICNPSIITVSQWVDHFRKFLPHLTVSVCKGGDPNALPDADVVVCTINAILSLKKRIGESETGEGEEGEEEDEAAALSDAVGELSHEGSLLPEEASPGADVSPAMSPSSPDVASAAPSERFLLNRWLSGFGTVIYDEIHCLGGEIFSSLIPLIVSLYQLGLSGTPTRIDGMEIAYTSSIGPIIESEKRLGIRPPSFRCEVDVFIRLPLTIPAVTDITLSGLLSLWGEHGIQSDRERHALTHSAESSETHASSSALKRETSQSHASSTGPKGEGRESSRRKREETDEPSEDSGTSYADAVKAITLSEPRLFHLVLQLKKVLADPSEAVIIFCNYIEECDYLFSHLSCPGVLSADVVERMGLIYKNKKIDEIRYLADEARLIISTYSKGGTAFSPVRFTTAIIWSTTRLRLAQAVGRIMRWKDGDDAWNARVRHIMDYADCESISFIHYSKRGIEGRSVIESRRGYYRGKGYFIREDGTGARAPCVMDGRSSHASGARGRERGASTVGHASSCMSAQVIEERMKQVRASLKLTV